MIIGHREIIEDLENIIKNGKLSNSYIFSGINGVGKKKLAVDFSKMILCKNSIDETKFDKNNHPDFKIISPDEKNSIKIECIRNIVLDVNIKPIESDYKIYIIDEADKITKQGQNALLKTLEEPPKLVIIILITSNYYGIIDTIRSRSTQISFNKLKDEEIKEYIKKENIVFDFDENVLLQLADGSIGEIKEILNNQELIQYIIELKNRIKTLSLIDVQQAIKRFSDNKEIISNLLKYMCQIYYLSLKNNLEDKKEIERISNCIIIIEKTKNYLKNNINFDICMDYLFNTIWEEYHV